jgi:hypothetical protein
MKTKIKDLMISSLAHPTLLFQRTWPVAFFAASFVAQAAWVGLLGYGIFKLGELAI